MDISIQIPLFLQANSGIDKPLWYKNYKFHIELSGIIIDIYKFRTIIYSTIFMERELIKFDIFIGKDEDALEDPYAYNAGTVKPDPEIVEKCKQYLSGKGIACNVTDFGLSGSAKKSIIESVFATELAEVPPVVSTHQWEFVKEPIIPDTLKPHIRQISFPS